MSSEPMTTAEELTFRGAAGEPVSILAKVDREGSRVGEFLTARRVWLNGRECRQLRVAAVPDRGAGYERLDNEILAGRRLNEVAGDLDYPPGVSRLHADEAESAEPFVLLEPYIGEPLQAVVGNMMDAEQRDFEFGFLTGLCWLDAARIAHRDLTPSTLRWDSTRRQAQITDFSLCTVFGVPREAIGAPDWVGPEQRAGGKVSGLVSNRDDMHPAARLIYYVRSQGEKLTRLEQLAEVGLGYLEPLFGPPEKRPTARELLASRQGMESPVPRGLGSDAQLKEGHEVFDARRREKHPYLGGQETPPPTAPSVPDQSNGTAPRDSRPPRESTDRGKRLRFRLGGRS
jgi:serine/threonine protein kinase